MAKRKPTAAPTKAKARAAKARAATTAKSALKKPAAKKSAPKKPAAKRAASTPARERSSSAATRAPTAKRAAPNRAATRETAKHATPKRAATARPARTTTTPSTPRRAATSGAAGATARRAATRPARTESTRPEKPLRGKASDTPQINLLGDASSARRASQAIAPGAGAHALGRELGDVVAVEVEAEAALETGDLPRAIAIYTRLIEGSPAPIASHLIARGRAFYRAGDHESAIGDFERGLAIEPHYPDLYFDKGKAELQAGRVGDAEASFTQDLELDPSPISFYNRHLARKALGDRDGALVDLDCAIEGMPDEPALRVARAIMRHAIDDHAGAFSDADAAATLAPDDIGHQDLCGRLALLAGRDDRAAEAYATARALAAEAGEPPNPKHLEGEALALAGLGRPTEAMPLFDRAVALIPNEPTFLCNRGWTLHLLGRNTDALADLDRAIAIDPAYATALKNRATVHIALGDRNRALADYRTLDALGHDVRDAIARLVAP